MTRVQRKAVLYLAFGLALVIVLALAVISRHESHPAAGRSSASTTSATQASDPNDPLRGVGAPRDIWEQTHGTPLLGYTPGCCYGPVVKPVFGSPAPEWANVIYGTEPPYRVEAFTHSLNGRGSESKAIAALQQQDLPADAILDERRRDDPRCYLMQWTSAELAARTNGAHVLVELSSRPGGQYDGLYVDSADVFVTHAALTDVGC